MFAFCAKRVHQWSSVLNECIRLLFVLKGCIIALSVLNRYISYLFVTNGCIIIMFSVLNECAVRGCWTSCGVTRFMHLNSYSRLCFDQCHDIQRVEVQRVQPPARAAQRALPVSTLLSPTVSREFSALYL